MEDVINWISTNKTWLFEGIGVVIILGIVRYFWKRNKETKNEPTVSNTATGSGNIQAGRDVNIQKEEKKN